MHGAFRVHSLARRVPSLITLTGSLKMTSFRHDMYKPIPNYTRLGNGGKLVPKSLCDKINKISRNDNSYNDNITTIRWVFAMFRVQQHLDFTLGTQTELLTIVAKNQPKTAADIKWRGFVNIYLDSSDADAMLEMAKEYDNHLDVKIGEMVKEGIQIKLSWDTRSKCFMASMTTRNPEAAYAGYCITSRSRDMSEVLWMCVYKHFVVCSGDWSQYAGADDGYRWG